MDDIRAARARRTLLLIFCAKVIPVVKKLTGYQLTVDDVSDLLFYGALAYHFVWPYIAPYIPQPKNPTTPPPAAK